MPRYPRKRGRKVEQSRLDRLQAPLRLSSPSPRAKRDKPSRHSLPPSETTRTIGWSGSRGTDAIYFVYTGCPTNSSRAATGADRGRLVFGWPETRGRGVPVERPGAAPGPGGQRRFVGLGKRRVLFPPPERGASGPGRAFARIRGHATR